MSISVPDFPTALLHAMRFRGWRQVDLARHLGESPTQITRWLQGQKPTEEKRDAVLRQLGARYSDTILFNESSSVAEDPAELTYHPPRAEIPIVGTVRADGTHVDFDESRDTLPTSPINDTFPIPPGSAPELYAVQHATPASTTLHLIRLIAEPKKLPDTLRAIVQPCDGTDSIIARVTLVRSASGIHSIVVASHSMTPYVYKPTAVVLYAVIVGTLITDTFA